MTLKATLYNNVPGPELVHCSYIGSVWKKYLRPSCKFAEVLDVTTKVPILNGDPGIEGRQQKLRNVD